MSKYEKAYDEIFKMYVEGDIQGSMWFRHNLDIIKELVDRTIPMKPHITFRYTATVFGDMHEVKEERCPNCYQLLYRDWSCVNNDCRQAIDWEKGENK